MSAGLQDTSIVNVPQFLALAQAIRFTRTSSVSLLPPLQARQSKMSLSGNVSNESRWPQLYHLLIARCFFQYFYGETQAGRSRRHGRSRGVARFI
jgi:hypothetical protein